MTTKQLSNRSCHPVLGEIRDDQGNWVTGWMTYSRLAGTVGTTTPDLIRRLSILGIVARGDGRNQVTPLARREGYGTVHWRKAGGGQRVRMDVILPDGMVLLVQNLEATNAPLTEAEELSRQGFSLGAIAARLGVSKPAVLKRLRSVPSRLKNWPVVGTWKDEGDGADNDNTVNLSAYAC